LEWEDEGMAVLRTPDARFEGLSGWDYAPHYTEVDGGSLGSLRIAHVDVGPADGPVMLLMHGEPSWSYLYRKMISVLVAAGFRCLAPDLVGFGRSDKPSEQSDYSYAAHVDWMLQWFRAQNLSAAPGIRGQHEGVTLFCQDWGGLIGLRLVAAMPDSFARVCAANTFLPTGEGKPSKAFEAWRNFSQSVPDFDSGFIVTGGTARGISDEARAAYNAPYPDDSFKAGARRFPMLVPTSPEMDGAAENREAWKVLEAFEKPFLTLFGDSDFVTLGAEKQLQTRIPGAVGQPHRLIERAGHFLQEDAGEEIAAYLVDWAR
jgi:haloalkane dehalogenase